MYYIHRGGNYFIKGDDFLPRIAIRDYNTSFFHIMVQGIRKEYVFKEDTDIKTYLKLIYKYVQKYKVKIIAFCIMNNHAHLLIYIEKINELSEFMRAVNTTYALYYNKKYKRTGYVFRNRYKAEPIFDEIHLINCINYIHYNPVNAKMCNSIKDYKYSSYREYKGNNGKIIKFCKNVFPQINKLFIDNIDIEYNGYCNFIDYVRDIEFLNENDVIKNFVELKKINIEDIVRKKEYLKEIAIKLSKECNLTHEEIANKFNVSRIKITRIINRE